MPNSKFVLSTVEIKGGNKENGATRQLMTFEYENGLYDRYEREFLGFEKVKSHQHDTENDDAVYRTITQVFGNKNFLCKGLLLSEVTTDNSNDKLSEKINTYVSDTVQNGGVFQALSKTVSIEYT